MRVGWPWSLPLSEQSRVPPPDGATNAAVAHARLWDTRFGLAVPGLQEGPCAFHSVLHMLNTE
jgi:hypothetical protein